MTSQQQQVHVDPTVSSSGQVMTTSTTTTSSAANKKSSNITPFRVFARVRPFIPTELEGTSSDKLRSCVEMVENKTILLNPTEDFAPKAEYAFDDSFWSIPGDYKMRRVFADTERKPYASQKVVYDATAKGCADLAMEAINSCIMSYGQTGTGKTYTMLGEYDPDTIVGGGDGLEGIIPRVCHDVFESVEHKRLELARSGEADRISFDVEVIFVEVYMEKVRDLLDPALHAHRRHSAPATPPMGSSNSEASTNTAMKEAKIRLDPEGGPYIEGVTKYNVDSWKDCRPLLERGQSMRRTCSTTVHQQSSRSHAIFQLTVVQEIKNKPKFPGGPPVISKKTGRINLVDLAGSERGGHQEYVKESSQINKSLLTLRRVIDQLVEKQSSFFENMKQQIQQQQREGSPSAIVSSPSTTSPASSAIAHAVVPYRESVLTWLLSDSIGGNACTTMIAAMSPHQKNFQETYSTLLWSSKARGLVSIVKVNDVGKSVTQGMGSKLAEMEERLSLQKQNVDIIRQELSLKGEMISQMESDLARSREASAATVSASDAFIATAAALTIQRGHLARRQQRSIEKLEEAKTTVQSELDSSDAEYSQLQEARSGLDKAMKSEQEKLELAKLEKETIQRELEEYEKKELTFGPEFDRLMKQHQETSSTTGDDGDNAATSASRGAEGGPLSPARSEREKIEQLRIKFAEEIKNEEEKIKTLQEKTTKAKEELEKLVKEIIPELEKKVEDLKNDQQFMAQREKEIQATKEMEEENKKVETENKPLRSKKQELQDKLKKLNEELKKKKSKK